jgi:hypothetical protein
MNEKLFRTLLYQSEGPDLDFKAMQYAFKGADDTDKSKLLKDILAFANSWRLGDAHILIGVKELAHGNVDAFGIPPSDHIDDASLQQFVNSKTNRAVKLSYQAFNYEGKSFGVITIPKQKRPFYAKAKFGLVEASAVYFRRGSSCATATPEDVARMGADDENDSRSSPLIRLETADIRRHVKLGDSALLNTIYHEEHKATDYPDHVGSRNNYLALTYVNKNFWRELADYTWAQRAFAPVGLAATNIGAEVARNVRLEAAHPKDQQIRFMDHLDMPNYPQASHDIGPPNFVPHALDNNRVIAPSLLDHVDRFTILVTFGDIQPQATAWTQKPLFAAASASGVYDLEFSIYADNLSQPQQAELKLKFEVESRPTLQLDDLKKVHQEYWQDVNKLLEDKGY